MAFRKVGGQSATGCLHRREGLEDSFVSPRLTFHVIQCQCCCGRISGREEARQGQQGRNLIAHSHRLGRRANTRVGPCHSHKAQFAVERRHIERDGSFATIQLHRLRDHHDGLRRHDRETGAANLVAALTDVASRALVGIKQTTIIVAQFDTETALAEEVVGWVRRLEAGQQQDALIDGRQLDITIIVRSGSRDVHGHLAVRPLNRRGSNIELERARADVDRYMSDAHGATWFRRLGGIARRIDRRHDIDAGAPLLGDR